MMVLMIAMVHTVFTIGYSGFQLNDFVKILKDNGILLVIDVRSLPYSQHYADFNKENISKTLESSKIYYRNYASEFGARQREKKNYPNGYLDFNMFSKSKQFLSGIEKLEKSMQQDYTFALMCSEKDPMMCHRSILVARAFYLSGYNIIHLLPNGKTTTQADVEERLLNKFFPDRNQINLFSENLSTEEYIEEAYKKQNAIIGYTIEG